MAKILTPLQLQYVDGKVWLLADDFIVISHPWGIIRVPKGFRTDLTSIPKGLWNILPKAEGGEAAVLHDQAYQTGKIGITKVTRQQADALYREFAQYRNAPTWKITVIYAALRIGGFRVWNKYRALDSP